MGRKNVLGIFLVVIIVAVMVSGCAEKDTSTQPGPIEITYPVIAGFAEDNEIVLFKDGVGVWRWSGDEYPGNWTITERTSSSITYRFWGEKDVEHEGHKATIYHKFDILLLSNHDARFRPKYDNISGTWKPYISGYK
jgi:hypothetical protein